MRLKISQTYRLDPDRYMLSPHSRDNRHLGPVGIEWDFSPIPHVGLRSRSMYDVNNNDWVRSNNDLFLTTSRGDSASIGYHYTKGLIEEINLSIRARITRSLDMEVILKRNELASRTVEQTYAVDYRRQCWGLRVGYSDTADDRRVFASLQLYGFGF
jgi:hypothetical protein